MYPYMNDLQLKIQCCCFQYAVCHRTKCKGCREYIPNKSLRVKFEFDDKYYHFGCFWKHETTVKCSKSQIMIAVEKCRIWHYPYASLEILEQNLNQITTLIVPLIRPEDLYRILQHLALDHERKTPYYIPTVVREEWIGCPYCYSPQTGFMLARDNDFCLKYNDCSYHPKCLAEAGIVNIDAKDMHDYDTLDDNDKKLLDGLFKKNNEAGPFFAAVDKLILERCASKECNNKVLSKFWNNEPTSIINEWLGPEFWLNELFRKELPAEEYCYKQWSGIEYRDLRIRYKHLSYHPQCFAALEIVNVDGKDISNYDKMCERNKMILDSYFIKKDDHNIPSVEKAKEANYCNAAKCLVCRTSLKFPYRYTIAKDQLQIRFQGYVYHPQCFQAIGKSEIAAKDMKNYKNLSDKEKQLLDGIFKTAGKRKLEEDKSNVSKKYNEEASTKKKKLSDGTTFKGTSKASTNLKRKMVSDGENNCISSAENAPAQKRSKINKSTLHDTVTDENDPGLLNEQLPAHNKSKSKKSKPHVDQNAVSTHRKPKPSASVATNSIYHFEKPPTSKLQEICDKLNIEYRKKATKLWDKIVYEQLDTGSNPSETHYFETDNFYQILSIFFTGKSKHHEQIKTTIIDAFREKMVSSGEISTKKFNKKYFDTVTDEHLSFIAKFLKCRILIFDRKNRLQKYGKWKSTTSIRLTLVVELKDEYYSIALKF